MLIVNFISNNSSNALFKVSFIVKNFICLLLLKLHFMFYETTCFSKVILYGLSATCKLNEKEYESISITSLISHLIVTL
jgi:hypothetical protein